VPSTTADALSREFDFRPDVVKIDVEGHEAKVLRGMWDLINCRRPLIFLELHPERLAEEGDDMFEEAVRLDTLGYELRLPDGRSESPLWLASQSAVDRIVLCPASKS
jgi:Methyltransferase FkbM domain